jgi:uncharacterized protein (TIGR02588 family)
MPQDSRKNPSADIPLVEWIISVLGLLIVIAVVGVLVYEAVAGDKSPPDVKLTVQSIEPSRNSGFLVKIRAENVGGEPAAHVLVTAEVLDQQRTVESSETQFAHLPPHSYREAGVFFQRDPRPHEIRLRPGGYEEP